MVSSATIGSKRDKREEPIATPPPNHANHANHANQQWKEVTQDPNQPTNPPNANLFKGATLSLHSQSRSLSPSSPSLHSP